MNRREEEAARMRREDAAGGVKGDFSCACRLSGFGVLGF